MANSVFFFVLIITLAEVSFVSSEGEIECHDCYFAKGLVGNEKCSKNPGDTGTKISNPCASIARNGTALLAQGAEVKAMTAKCATVEASVSLDTVSLEVVGRGAICVDESITGCTNVLPPNWQDFLPDLGVEIPENLEIRASICYCDSDKCNDGHTFQNSVAILSVSLALTLSVISWI